MHFALDHHVVFCYILPFCLSLVLLLFLFLPVPLVPAFIVTPFPAFSFILLLKILISWSWSWCSSGLQGQSSWWKSLPTLWVFCSAWVLQRRPGHRFRLPQSLQSHLVFISQLVSFLFCWHGLARVCLLCNEHLKIVSISQIAGRWICKVLLKISPLIPACLNALCDPVAVCGSPGSRTSCYTSCLLILFLTLV